MKMSGKTKDRGLRAFAAALPFLLGLFFLQSGAEAMPQPKRAAFAVIDRTGSVSEETQRSWREVVRWAYRYPYYSLEDVEEGAGDVASALSKASKDEAAALALVAEKRGADALIVARINELDEKVMSAGILSEDADALVLVTVSADLFVCKREGRRLLKKRLRERGRLDAGSYEAPEDTVRWALCDLVNAMEGRPKIR